MKNKTFDCVEMKNRIQRELLEQEARIGAEQMRRRREEWLRTGQDELSRLWRRLRACQRVNSAGATVREDAADKPREAAP